MASKNNLGMLGMIGLILGGYHIQPHKLPESIDPKLRLRMIIEKEKSNLISLIKRNLKQGLIIYCYNNERYVWARNAKNAYRKLKVKEDEVLDCINIDADEFIIDVYQNENVYQFYLNYNSSKPAIFIYENTI